jgi:hypothetical protein
LTFIFASQWLAKANSPDEVWLMREKRFQLALHLSERCGASSQLSELIRVSQPPTALNLIQALKNLLLELGDDSESALELRAGCLSLAALKMQHPKRQISPGIVGMLL